MIDSELKLLTDWRFVPIALYEKGPKVRDWQKKLHTLDQIPQNSNIGVILGPASNGIIAIDFDGPWTWEYWIEQIKIPFNTIDTVTCTSNKPGRCQMAFSVPQLAWDIMPAKFAISGPIGDDGKPQQLEFRWGTMSSGCQSVLPPSLHPDTKTKPNIFYNWVRKPSEVNVQEIPADLLEFILNYKKPEEIVEPVEKFISKNVDGEEANKLCEELKEYYPSLDYETWIRVTWAFCNTVGYDDGIAIMKYYYPETTSGEYKKLMNSKRNGKVCTIGTVIKMINDRKPKQQSIKSLVYKFNRN